MNLDIESIEHLQTDGTGFARHEQRLRQAYTAGREFRIEAGRRAEFTIGPGERAVVFLLEGSVRFEGDDTAAGEGDTVWFKPAPREEAALLGVEADRPARGILVASPPKELRPAR
jgi:redox-sensitive bicupin YhaK (pirin superfamily)